MRLSSDPDDEGYDIEKAQKYRVLLDGKGVHWSTADDVKGEVKVTAFTASGAPDINPMTGYPWTVWRTGHVQFLSLQ